MGGAEGEGCALRSCRRASTTDEAILRPLAGHCPEILKDLPQGRSQLGSEYLYLGPGWFMGKFPMVLVHIACDPGADRLWRFLLFSSERRDPRTKGVGRCIQFLTLPDAVNDQGVNGRFHYPDVTATSQLGKPPSEAPINHDHDLVRMFRHGLVLHLGNSSGRAGRTPPGAALSWTCGVGTGCPVALLWCVCGFAYWVSTRFA
jgi:hypothetical protein